MYASTNILRGNKLSYESQGKRTAKYEPWNLQAIPQNGLADRKYPTAEAKRYAKGSSQRKFYDILMKDPTESRLFEYLYVGSA